MPGPAFARGDRVSLHPVEEEDYEFVQYGRNHPDVRVPLTDTTIRSSDDVAEMFEDADYHFLICVGDGGESTNDESGETASAAEDTDDLEAVGVVAFPWVRDGVQVGSLMYWVAPDHQGNGYVTEATELFLDYAFGECGFHKVNARVNADNGASASVLENLGFEREGTRRAESVVDGEWVDMHMYGLLADEWLDA
ncbi:GNAT family N-acetyltransferase [Halobacterium litoreum]|uniref:GNAT family N-acetyltransferase n=1 Tax=Halobacterium litoreum TaxID=2039234 RepID=A0ABD5NEV1_9EURY|nr:GNAT family protein [Halobacterium litoreum]UHH13417.1 GNAT family N-acetyltransferase [Halobacterium litoreum]